MRLSLNFLVQPDDVIPHKLVELFHSMLFPVVADIHLYLSQVFIYLQAGEIFPNTSAKEAGVKDDRVAKVSWFSCCFFVFFSFFLIFFFSA